MTHQSTAFTAFAEKWRPVIDQELERHLSGEMPHKVLQESMKYSALSPGKRLRPLLVLLASEVCGGNPADALPAACAVEMIHAFSLIHDDLPCMDDDDLRRGKPTNHKVYGEALALLAGDALLADAFRVLSALPSDVCALCVKELAAATGSLGMTGGQALDMDGSAKTVEALDGVHQLKTGAIIEASLRMGAMIGKVSNDQLAVLSEYGRAFGLVFQITDDVLDVTGTQERTGKGVQKDTEKGKVTYPQLLGIEGSRARAEAIMQKGVEELSLFGEKAAPFRALADSVLTRVS